MKFGKASDAFEWDLLLKGCFQKVLRSEGAMGTPSMSYTSVPNMIPAMMQRASLTCTAKQNSMPDLAQS